MKNLYPLCLTLLFFNCQTNSEKEDKETYQTPKNHISELTDVFDAHGSYKQWDQMNTLSYKRGDESTITDLKSRKIRLESPSQIIGYDGEDVWVTPDSVDASRARFYHNLYFYFYAMPFVVGDPGAYYEVLEQRQLAGKIYNQVKVSYNENVGDAPDDNYIILSDPETNQMKWLLYTVTYRSGEPSERYSLIGYENWTDIGGLRLPTSLKWFQFNADTVGEARSEVFFEEIKILAEQVDPSIFSMPEGAQIAPR